MLRGSGFPDGAIEVELAGLPGGRAEDQVPRNHSMQYSSHPGHDFARLRREEPEKYESYVDLEPGAPTRVKIEVKGAQAMREVHGAAQPCLIVNGRKSGARRGAPSSQKTRSVPVDTRAAAMPLRSAVAPPKESVA